MQEFPHRYCAVATGISQGEVAVEAERLPKLTTAPPAEFGGPGDVWSPETLLVAAVADCFVLSFRAIARGSKFSWLSLSCNVEGTLDRVDRVTQFTEFLVRASLRVPTGADEEKAQRLLARAEQSCLITNSLKAPSHLDVAIEFGPEG
jgi:organic hydroperoxide reductase OsmC/OhrA